jgi:hypothetical protein
MTHAEVLERLADIRRVAVEEEDPEAAHGMEDRLMKDVLRAIASGEGDRPEVLATAALSVDTLDFPRWYA